MWKTALPKTDIYSHWKEAFINGKSCSQSPFFRESTPLVVGTPFGELVFVVWQHHPAGPKENAGNRIKPFFGDVDVRGIWRRFARACWSEGSWHQTTKPPNHQDSTKFPLTQSVNQPSRPNHQLSPFALSHHHTVIAVKSIREWFFSQIFFLLLRMIVFTVFGGTGTTLQLAWQGFIGTTSACRLGCGFWFGWFR